MVGLPPVHRDNVEHRLHDERCAAHSGHSQDEDSREQKTIDDLHDGGLHLLSWTGGPGAHDLHERVSLGDRSSLIQGDKNARAAAAEVFR